MIVSFKSKHAEDIYDGLCTKQARKIPINLHKICFRKLDQLNAAVHIEDLKAPPKNCLEKLKGNFEGIWSIRVNNQYRITFKWEDANAYDVNIVDYH